MWIYWGFGCFLKKNIYICLIFEYTQQPFVSKVPGSEFAFLETSPNK